MTRKRITQIFPWLLPIRRKQRLFCFYAGMKRDGNQYARTQSEYRLPVELFESYSPMYNKDTGFDMIYQENKVHNLKLAAATVDRLLIRPGETFSFYQAARYADRETPYKDGLVLVDGKLTTESGGGLCQISNLLFWVFLHSPLTIVERHGHKMKDFPDPSTDTPLGVDATIAEGWLDLKVKNETDTTFQVSVTFDSEHIIGRLLADRDGGILYQIENEEPTYYRETGSIYEEVDVIRKQISRETGDIVASEKLYRNRCKIGYDLPMGTLIQERGQEGGKR